MTDPFRLDSQFEFSRAYSHQYEQPLLLPVLGKLPFVLFSPVNHTIIIR